MLLQQGKREMVPDQVQDAQGAQCLEIFLGWHVKAEMLLRTVYFLREEAEE